MAEYKDFDEAVDKSQITWGVHEFGKGSTESLRHSWWATNRGVFIDIPNLIRGVSAAVAALPGLIVDAIAARRWEYWNQEDVPVGKRGTNNLFEATQAINGRVFDPACGLKALGAKLDALAVKVDALAPKAAE